MNDFDAVIAQYNWEDDGVIMDILTCVRDMVYDKPTAYDIDEVVERLKDYAIEFEAFGQCSDYVELSHAIEIVKGGK